jgi:hypothetical protein
MSIEPYREQTEDTEIQNWSPIMEEIQLDEDVEETELALQVAQALATTNTQAVEAVKKEDIAKAEPAIPPDFIGCLKRLIEMRVKIRTDYSSPCSGRCPNGLIGKYILGLDLKQTAHEDIVTMMEEKNIWVRTYDWTCPICKEQFFEDEEMDTHSENDESWIAYHQAQQHKWSLRQIVAELGDKQNE